MNLKSSIIIVFGIVCLSVTGCHSAQKTRSASIGLPCESIQSMGEESAGWECIRGVPTCAAESGCQHAGMHYPTWYVLGTEPKPPKQLDGYILVHKGYLCNAESCACGESAVRKESLCNADQFASGDGIGTVLNEYYHAESDQCGHELCGAGGVCAEGRCLCDGKSDGPANKNEYECRKPNGESKEQTWFCNRKEGCTCGDAICPAESQCIDGRCLCGTMDVTPATSQQRADIVTLDCFNDVLTCMNTEGCSCGGDFCPMGAICRDGQCLCGRFNISAHGPDIPTDLSGYRCDDDTLLRCDSSASCTCGDQTIENHSDDEEYDGVSETAKYCVYGEILELDYEEFRLSEKSEISGAIRVNAHYPDSCEGLDSDYDICVEPNGCVMPDGQRMPFLHIMEYCTEYPGSGKPKRHSPKPLKGNYSCTDGYWYCTDSKCKCGENMCPYGAQCDNGQCSCFGEPVMPGYICGWQDGIQKCDQESCVCGSETIKRHNECDHNVPVCNAHIQTRCMCKGHMVPDGYKCGEEGDFVCENEDGCICGDTKCIKNEKCSEGQCAVPSWVCGDKPDTLKDPESGSTFCKDNMWCISYSSDGGENCLCPDGQSWIYSYRDDDGEHKQPCPTEEYISTFSQYKDRIRYSGDGLYDNAYRPTCGTDFVPEQLDSYVCLLHDAFWSSCDYKCDPYAGYDGWLCVEASGCGCGSQTCPVGSFCTKENGDFACNYQNKVFERKCDTRSVPVVCRSFSADLTPEIIARGGLLPVDYHSEIVGIFDYPGDNLHLPVGWICPNDAGCACGNATCAKGHFCLGPGHCSLNTGTIPNMTYKSWILGEDR